MRRIAFGLIVLAAWPSHASAQAVKSTVTASNGVEVTVYSDDFANRYEYSSPSTKSGDGQISVYSVRKASGTRPIFLSGFFIYSGEWRRYTSALYKGGEPAKFTSTGRDVGQCSSSRYSRPSCVLTESFDIELTPAEMRAHDEGGTVAVQIRADDTSTVIFNVPVASFKAVAEVAKVDIDPPAPVAAPPPVALRPAVKPQPRRPAPASRRR